LFLLLFDNDNQAGDRPQHVFMFH